MNSALKTLYKMSFIFVIHSSLPFMLQVYKVYSFSNLSKTVNPWPKIFYTSNLRTVAICPENSKSNRKSILGDWDDIDFDFNDHMI